MFNISFLPTVIFLAHFYILLCIYKSQQTMKEKDSCSFILTYISAVYYRCGRIHAILILCKYVISLRLYHNIRISSNIYKVAQKQFTVGQQPYSTCRWGNNISQTLSLSDSTLNSYSSIFQNVFQQCTTCIHPIRKILAYCLTQIAV